MRMYFDAPGAPLREPELHAARLDGDIVELGLAWIPSDAIETPELRAASLAPILDDGLVAIGLTAAWIHGALAAPPCPVTAQRAMPGGARRAGSRMLRVRDVPLRAEDQRVLGGVRVSSRERTLADLAAAIVAGGRDASGALEAAARLAAEPGLIDAALRALSERTHVPHGRRIRQWLGAARHHAAGVQDDVTR